jgi:hypothetical protein
MKHMSKLPVLITLGIIFSLSLAAQEAVAWIVGGHEKCIIERTVKGSLKKLNAEHKMKLYPGDKILKPGKINSVQVDFRPYAKAVKKSDGSLVIVFKPPGRMNKENFLEKIGKFLGLVKVNFYEQYGASRAMEWIDLPGENATVIPGQKIDFSYRYIGKEIAFKTLRGKEIFRKKIEKDQLSLTPEEIGLVPSGIYIWEPLGEGSRYAAQTNGVDFHSVPGKGAASYRYTMKLSSKKDGDLIGNDLKKIDSEKISEDEKKLKKAAYLQMMSDLYPTEINLYWLSYRFIMEIGNQNKEIKDLADTLRKRCFNHFNRGISGIDFEILKSSPGCFVTIEWKNDQERRFVNPDFSFYEKPEYGFRIHFQTNFNGCAVILYEDEKKGECQPVFPFNSSGYDVKPNANRYTIEYEFYGGPCKEKYIFILTKRPIEEIKKLKHLLDKQNQTTINQSNSDQKKLLEGLLKRAKKQGKELKMELMGTKAFVTTTEKDLAGMVWFSLYLKNMGKN